MELCSFWGEASAERVFGGDSGMGELSEVVVAAGFGAGAREAESAERLAADEGSGDGAVQVQVADAEFLGGAGEVAGGAGEEAAGEFVGGVVGEGEGVVKVAGAENREDGAEDFFAGDAMAWEDVGEDVGRN